MAEDALIIKQTEAWVQRLIVKYNICPFARQELEQRSIRYAVERGKFEAVLERLAKEWQLLDDDRSTETTLLMLTEFDEFADFLDLIAVAEQFLAMNDYEGVYQLAHFHPHYCFAGEAEEDPANYTNRAPFATLHILREDSMEQALAGNTQAELIPQRNIEFARRRGNAFFQQLLANVRSTTE